MRRILDPNATLGKIDAATLIEQQAEQIAGLASEKSTLNRTWLQKWDSVCAERDNAESEAAALRKVIEDAPHEHKCNSFWHRPGDCTCWKSKAAHGV